MDSKWVNYIVTLNTLVMASSLSCHVSLFRVPYKARTVGTRLSGKGKKRSKEPTQRQGALLFYNANNGEQPARRISSQQLDTRERLDTRPQVGAKKKTNVAWVLRVDLNYVHIYRRACVVVDATARSRISSHRDLPVAIIICGKSCCFRQNATTKVPSCVYHQRFVHLHTRRSLPNAPSMYFWIFSCFLIFSP